MSLTPALFTSAASDASDATKLRPSNWNRVTGLLTTLLGGVDATGSLFVKNGGGDGAGWLAPGAAGTVLGGTGTTPAFTATPSLTSLTLSTPLAVGSGGTGLALFAVGDIPYASGTTTLAKLAGVAAGAVMVSGTAPAWSATPSLTSLTLSTPLTPGNGGTGLASYAIGDIPYASGTATLSKLADVAVGSVMVSGGVGAAPAWSATPTLTSLTLDTAGSLAWSTDLFLVRDGANTLAQRNGTNAQQLRIYNTFTNATNYERLEIGPVSNTFRIEANALGSGTQRAMEIGTHGAQPIHFYTTNAYRWNFSAAGHLLAFTDNTYDIGATNATRPRHAHLAGYLAIGDGITAPGAGTGEARIYVDTADGDLKIVYADGVVKTIVVDT